MRNLQSRVNKDSASVAKKYLRIDPKGREREVANLLKAKMSKGQLSDVVIDEVNEYALLQKGNWHHF